MKTHIKQILAVIILLTITTFILQPIANAEGTNSLENDIISGRFTLTNLSDVLSKRRRYRDSPDKI